MTRRAVGFLLILVAVPVATARVQDKVMDVSGTEVHYKIVLPKDYDPAKAYPAVLAFPPGSQTMDMVLTTVLRNWQPEAERSGYIVVTPAAPLGRVFIREGAGVFPEFIEKLLGEYKIRDNKFHIAGMSNGGLSAFHIAASYPRYFWSVTGFPGYLPDATPARVAALTGMCINLFVGELDTGWRRAIEYQAAEFRAQGLTVRMSVEPGQGHVMSTLTGARSARLFQGMQQGCAK